MNKANFMLTGCVETKPENIDANHIVKNSHQSDFLILCFCPWHVYPLKQLLHYCTIKKKANIKFSPLSN